MDIRLSGDLGIYVGLSSNLLMHIRLSGDLGINIGLSLNVLMDVSLSSRVEVSISYRWVIDSSIDCRGSSIAIVGSDWGSGIGGRDWGSGVGGSSKRGNTMVGYRGSSSVSIGLGVSIGGGSIHLSCGLSGD